jgi:hypothetical protein
VRYRYGSCANTQPSTGNYPTPAPSISLCLRAVAGDIPGMDGPSTTPTTPSYLVPATVGAGIAVPSPIVANPNTVSVAFTRALFVPMWPNSQPGAAPPVSLVVSKGRAGASKRSAATTSAGTQMPVNKAAKKLVARLPARPPAPSAP